MQGSPADLLVRLLGACELRARVVSANIANSNTPGYIRQRVRFEELLRSELARGRRDLEAVQPEVAPDLLSPARPDGNNVNLELELNQMRENRLLYETYAAILRSHFNLLDVAVNSGR
jgi:flagellar basal-body rod protein FlgB